MRVDQNQIRIYCARSDYRLADLQHSGCIRVTDVEDPTMPGICQGRNQGSDVFCRAGLELTLATIGQGNFLAPVEQSFHEPPFARVRAERSMDRAWTQNSSRAHRPLDESTLHRDLSRGIG